MRSADVDSARTINRRVGSLQAFLRQLREHGGVVDYVLNKYPKQKTLGTEKRKRRSLSKDECKKLLAKAPNERQAVYRFALLTGLRLGELANTTPERFNFKAKTITVHSKDPRHNNRQHTLPLHPSLVKIAKESCEGKATTDAILNVPSRFDAARLLRDDCAAAGVDTTHIDFHALRHTFITRLAEENVHPKILQELARHASIETTLRYYTHFKQSDERNAIAAISI